MTKDNPHLTAADRRGVLRQIPPDAWSRLAPLCSERREVGPRTVLSRAGTPLHESLLLLDGIMMRHISDRHGRRQMVSLQVPYDFVDLHSYPLGHLDHDVETLTSVQIAVFPHDRLREELRHDPALMQALWRLTLVDAAMHRHWTFRLGRLRAYAGLANFLCETDYRLRRAGQAQGDSFDLPLTQADLGDICGLTPIHVNRVLRDLREAGLCSLSDGRLTIHDREGLCRTGEFDPGYLYDVPPEADVRARSPPARSRSCRAAGPSAPAAGLRLLRREGEADGQRRAPLRAQPLQRAVVEAAAIAQPPAPPVEGHQRHDQDLGHDPGAAGRDQRAEGARDHRRARRPARKRSGWPGASITGTPTGPMGRGLGHGGQRGRSRSGSACSPTSGTPRCAAPAPPTGAACASGGRGPAAAACGARRPPRGPAPCARRAVTAAPRGEAEEGEEADHVRHRRHEGARGQRRVDAHLLQHHRDHRSRPAPRRRG